MRLLALGAALLLAGSASAQTTTRCSTDYFGNVTCRTDPQPGVDWGIPDPNAFQRGYENARRSMPPVVVERPPSHDDSRIYAQLGAKEAELGNLRRELETTRATLELLAAGKCEEAGNAAMRAGELSLALNIKRNCG